MSRIDIPRQARPGQAAHIVSLSFPISVWELVPRARTVRVHAFLRAEATEFAHTSTCFDGAGQRIPLSPALAREIAYLVVEEHLDLDVTKDFDTDLVTLECTDAPGVFEPGYIPEDDGVTITARPACSFAETRKAGV